jgi:bacillithiol system protein YtxJ
MIPWKQLDKVDQIDQLFSLSQQNPVIIFKHSTSCGTSSMVLHRLESGKANTTDYPWYFLDLLAYRDVSNTIASKTSVRHESPQLIILFQGKAVYHRSHIGIKLAEISGFLETLHIQN